MSSGDADPDAALPATGDQGMFAPMEAKAVAPPVAPPGEATPRRERDVLIVIRHGRAKRPTYVSDETDPDKRWKAYQKRSGSDAPRDIAITVKALKEVITKDLPTQGINIEVVSVWSAESDDRVKDAARLVAHAFNVPDDATTGLDEEYRPGPPNMGPWWGAKTKAAIETLEGLIADWFKQAPPGHKTDKALVVVGNAPAVDWLLDSQADFPIALEHAQIACLIRDASTGHFKTGARVLRCLRLPWLRPRWHLWWTITADDSSAIDALRIKLQSKMTVLSVLVGFATAALAGLLTALPEDDSGNIEITAIAGAAVLAIAILVLTGTLLAYDELAMPHRYWRARRSKNVPEPEQSITVWRPPSGAGSVLYQHMVCLWRWAIVGMLLAGIALGLVAMSVLAPIDDFADFADYDGGVLFATAAIVTGLVVLVWYRRIRPDLGTED